MKLAVLTVIVVGIIATLGLTQTGAVVSDRGYCDCIYQSKTDLGVISEVSIDTYKVRTTETVNDALCNKRCPILVGKKGQVQGKLNAYVAKITVCDPRKCCECFTQYYNVQSLPPGFYVENIEFYPWSSATPVEQGCRTTCNNLFGTPHPFNR